jgi:hypothetical protein
LWNTDCVLAKPLRVDNSRSRSGRNLLTLRKLSEIVVQTAGGAWFARPPLVLHCQFLVLHSSLPRSGTRCVTWCANPDTTTLTTRLMAARPARTRERVNLIRSLSLPSFPLFRSRGTAPYPERRHWPEGSQASWSFWSVRTYTILAAAFPTALGVILVAILLGAPAASGVVQVVRRLERAITGTSISRYLYGRKEEIEVVTPGRVYKLFAVVHDDLGELPSTGLGQHARIHTVHVGVSATERWPFNRQTKRIQPRNRINKGLLSPFITFIPIYSYLFINFLFLTACRRSPIARKPPTVEPRIPRASLHQDQS